LPQPPPTTTASSGTTTGSASNKPHKTKPAKLILSAASGDCWVQVRSRSATGKLLYEGTLQSGQTQRFVDGKSLWLQLGNPVYLRARLNGKHVTLPSRPSIVVATARGLRTLSTA
jgi:hypothetical protein